MRVMVAVFTASIYCCYAL